jgi:hypothetical protein
MNQELKDQLIGLGLTEDHIAKLEEAGVKEASDMQVFKTEEELASVTGAPLITNRKVFEQFKPKTESPQVASGDVNAEIAEGVQPSTSQVNNFAASLGIDPNILTMFMFAGTSGNAGMGMDISSMIPIAQIVAGYSPKVRNMFYFVMGQFETRFGVPIVVINENGSVNNELTIEYIQGLEEGRDFAEDNIYFDSDSNPHQVIGVGVDTQSVEDADPFESTRALQKNGMGIGLINWKNVSLEVKQVAYFAVQTGEIDPKDTAKMDNLRDKIKPGASRLLFSRIAPKAISKFNDASRTGSLPTLRVMLSRTPRRPEMMKRRSSMLLPDKNL